MQLKELHILNKRNTYLDAFGQNHRFPKRKGLIKGVITYRGTIRTIMDFSAQQKAEKHKFFKILR
jgi:hypothetical protein